MKVFPIYVRIFPFRWRLYCNVCAVDCPDYIRKTGYLCKLRFDVCLVYCIIWYRIYLAEMRLIPFKTAEMARLRAPWLIFDRSANSLWNDPAARKPSVVRTCIGTGNAWLLAVCLSKPRPNSVQISKRIALGKSESSDKPVIIMSQKILIVAEHPFISNATIRNIF